MSSDDNLAAFLDRLEDCFPGPELPDTWLAFRQQCEERERMGRERYGLSYLAKDATKESGEELADVAIYMYLGSLRQIRDAGRDDELALALEVSRLAYKAYEYSRLLAAKRLGAP